MYMLHASSGSDPVLESLRWHNKAVLLPFRTPCHKKNPNFIYLSYLARDYTALTLPLFLDLLSIIHKKNSRSFRSKNINWDMCSLWKQTKLLLLSTAKISCKNKLIVVRL